MSRLRHTASQLDIYVNGSPIPDEVMNAVVEVVVDQHSHLPHMFRIRLHDQTLDLIDGELFALTKPIEIVGLDKNGTHISLIQGEITAVEPTFGEGMVAELVVQGYDRSHRLYRETHTASYINTRDSDLAHRFAARAGLDVAIDTTVTVYDHIFQNNQSDLSFLTQRAWRIGFECFVDNKKLYFRKPKHEVNSGLSLEWGEDLISFRPRVSLAEQVEEVSVRGWNPHRQEAIVGRANKAMLYPNSKMGKTHTEADSFGRGKKTIVNQPVVSQSEADRLAQARLDEISGAYIEADGEAFRRPRIRAGKRVELQNLGKKYSGTYLVTNATHVFSNAGLRVYFKVRGSRLGTLAEQMTHREPLDRWPSVVTAVVTNTNDPKDWGRIKVVFPWMSEESESDWARVIGPGGGPNAGFMAVPDVGDEVLIAFEQGDFSRPFVLGGVWSTRLPIPQEAAQASNQQKPLVRSWRSRNGHWISMHDDRDQKIHMETTDGRYLELNDKKRYMELKSRSSSRRIKIDDKNRTLKIETTSGHLIELSDANREISIQTADGQQIVLDDKNHAITAANQYNAVRLSPSGVQVDSKVEVIVKADLNLYLQAAGNVTIRGANIKLEKYNKGKHAGLGKNAPYTSW